LITRDIDKFEDKLNAMKTKIRELRGEAVIILTKENSEKNCAAKETDSLSYLEIEQKICQLEDESHELESKRREAVSRLQNKMVGNILGKEQKDLLPLLPTPMPEDLSASVNSESQDIQTSFEVQTAESSPFSRPATSSDTEASEVEESSTEKEKLSSEKKETTNENKAIWL